MTLAYVPLERFLVHCIKLKDGWIFYHTQGCHTQIFSEFHKFWFDRTNGLSLNLVSCFTLSYVFATTRISIIIRIPTMPHRKIIFNRESLLNCKTIPFVLSWKQQGTRKSWETCQWPHCHAGSSHLFLHKRFGVPWLLSWSFLMQL